MAAKHWSETQEKTNTAGISLLLTVFRLGGRTLFHLSLWPVIVFYWLVSPTARRASRLYLDHVARTKKEPRPGCLATLKHIWRFADTRRVVPGANDNLTACYMAIAAIKALKDNDMRILEASATLPVLNKPTVFEGTPYFDGGLSDPIPYKRAFEDGMDKVVVVLTRNRHLPRKRSKDALPSWILKRSYPESAKALSMRADVYNSEIDGMAEYEKEGKLLCVYPETTEGITTTKFKVENIMKLYEAGYEKGPLVASFLKG